MKLSNEDSISRRETITYKTIEQIVEKLKKEQEKEICKLEIKAKEIVREYLKRNPYTMRKPSSIAHGAVYLAAKLEHAYLIQKAIANAKEMTTESNVRNAYKDIRKVLGLQGSYI